VSGAKPQAGFGLATAEEQDAQLWAGVRRQERSWAALFAAVLAILTIYFAGLNAYVLHKAVPRPLRLRLEVSAGQLRGSYRPQLIWRNPSGDVVRPIVWIDGEALREGFGATRLVEVGRSANLHFTVPQNTAGGTHEATLLLTRVSGDEALPATVSAPVTIGVTSGFLKNWFILRDWAVFALAAAAGFYVFCTVAYYPPVGSLRVVRLGQAIPYEKTICLRMLPVAWLLPWRRSVVPLRWIWKRAGMKNRSLAGQINFVFSTQPMLELPSVRRGKVLKRLSNAPPAATEHFGPAIRMADNIFTCEFDAFHRVEMQYLRPGSMPAGRASWRS
jgi:hypothetical protein